MGLIEIIGGAVAGAFVLLIGLARMRKKAHKQGREEAEETARRLDHENAAAIRDRARTVKRVQPKASDTRGFRD
jgi:excinuclease UvrABC nuclease subunit